MTKPQDPIEPVTATLPPVVQAPGAVCANCRSTLQGSYCHVCGQHVHNPLKSFRHALEDVFESFWHLDGRVFRTLRDICVPGRAINAYLGGQRVRYIPPLRLFVILSLFTFFIAHFAISTEGVQVRDNDAIAMSTDIREVERIRDEGLARIDKQRAERLAAGLSQASLTGLAVTENMLRNTAAARIAQLEEARRSGQPPPVMRDEFKLANGRAWHPVDNPVRIDGAPAVINRWANAGLARGEANLKRFAQNQAALKDAWLSAIPTALFFLVPVFALLLRVAYAFTPWTYLEHLVVALYSHSFILLASALLMLANIGARASGAPGLISAAETAGGFGMAGIMAWLLVAQRRVYRQGWPLTVLKYATLGMVYLVLVGIGAVAALIVVFLK